MNSGLRSPFGKLMVVLLVLVAAFVIFKKKSRDADELAELNTPTTTVVAPKVHKAVAIQPTANNEASQQARMNEALAKQKRCSTQESEPAFVHLPAYFLRNLHLSKDTYQGVLPKDGCWFVGQKIIVARKSDREGSPFWEQAAEVEIQKINPDNTVMTLIRDRSFGNQPGMLAPICKDICDKVIHEITPEMAKTHRSFVFLAKGEPRRPKLANATFFEFGTKDNWEKTHAKSFGTIRDQSFIVMTDLPSTFRGARLSSVMRYLKAQGAKEVLWYYGGLQKLEGGDLRPMPIGSVKVINAATLLTTPLPGAQFIYAKDLHGPSKYANAFSRQTIVARQNLPFDSFIKSLSTSDLERYSSDKAVNLPANVKLDKNRPVVVYGQSIWSWPPVFVLKNLERKGFKNLYWVRGGASEYIQWNNIKNAKNPISQL